MKGKWDQRTQSLTGALSGLHFMLPQVRGGRCGSVSGEWLDSFICHQILTSKFLSAACPIPQSK